MSTMRKHVHAYLRTLLRMYIVPFFWKEHILFLHLPLQQHYEMIIPSYSCRNCGPQKSNLLEVTQSVSRPGLEARALDSLDNILLRRLYLSAFIASKIRRALQEKQQIYIPSEMLDFCNLFGFAGFSMLHCSQLTLHQSRRETKICHLQKQASICTDQQILTQ